MTGDKKWILYNNVEGKRSWGNQSKPPPTTPKSGPHPGKIVCMMGLEGSLCYELLQEMKPVFDEKHTKLLNRKHIIFPQDIARTHVSLMKRQLLL